MSERIAAGTHLNTSLKVWLADGLLSWLDPEDAEAALLSEQSDLPKSAKQHHMFSEGVLALCWSVSTDQQGEALFPSFYWPVWFRSRELVWRGGGLRALANVFWEGVNMTDGITRKPSQQFRRAWNRAGFSCIPVHLPTCSLWWLEQLRCTVSTLCLPVWWDLTAPQSWTHQRKSKRGGQSNCKRPSYINGAKVLCFIWTCLGLFVCTPHSFILGEMQSAVFPPTLNTYSLQLVGL